MDLVVKFDLPSKGGREKIPDLNCGLYRAHLLVSGRPEGEYLGVQFVGCCGQIGFDLEINTTVNLPYEGIDYSALQPNALFVIKEGGKTVGSGYVKKL